MASRYPLRKTFHTYVTSRIPAQPPQFYGLLIFQRLIMNDRTPDDVISHAPPSNKKRHGLTGYHIPLGPFVPVPLTPTPINQRAQELESSRTCFRRSTRNRRNRRKKIRRSNKWGDLNPLTGFDGFGWCRGGPVPEPVQLDIDDDDDYIFLPDTGTGVWFIDPTCPIYLKRPIWRDRAILCPEEYPNVCWIPTQDPWYIDYEIPVAEQEIRYHYWREHWLDNTRHKEGIGHDATNRWYFQTKNNHAIIEARMDQWRASRVRLTCVPEAIWDHILEFTRMPEDPAKSDRYIKAREAMYHGHYFADHEWAFFNAAQF